MSNLRPTLNFLCIGAAKSGTTTLHELLKNHPEISLPKAKEVPYFNHSASVKKGFDWYLNQNFSKTDLKKNCGTVTPQYMLNQETAVNLTASRIKKQLPDVKLIVILRHPIDRTFSHFKTSVRRSGETRTFDQAIADLLSSSDLNTQRSATWDETNRFLFASEYGRILKDYYSLFDKKNILILFTDELKDSPKQVLKKVFKFLNVDDSYIPENIGQKHNRGGMQAKLPLLTPKYLYKIPFLRKFWRNFIPYRIRKLVEVKVNSWNAKPDNTKLDKSSKVYGDLIEFFKKDVKLLEKKSGQKTPWPEWSA